MAYYLANWLPWQHLRTPSTMEEKEGLTLISVCKGIILLIYLRGHTNNTSPFFFNCINALHHIEKCNRLEQIMS